MTVNYEANEENNEPIAPKTSIVGAHRVAQNMLFQPHLFDSLALWPEIRNQFTAPFRETLIPFEGLRESLKEIFSLGFFGLVEGIVLPENLVALSEEVAWERFIDLVHEDGIPLYAIPRSDTVLKLVRADGLEERRSVLIECRKSIFEDCRSALNGLRSDYSQEMGEFVLSGLDALENGYSDAAQALFTNTMDTVHQKIRPDRDDRKDITHHAKGDEVPESFSDMSIGDNLIFAALWNSHITFWPHRGEESPAEYSRHASVHGVSRQQYNLENCIKVLMLVTSLLVYIDNFSQETG